MAGLIIRQDYYFDQAEQPFNDQQTGLGAYEQARLMIDNVAARNLTEPPNKHFDGMR